MSTDFNCDVEKRYLLPVCSYGCPFGDNKISTLVTSCVSK